MTDDLTPTGDFDSATAVTLQSGQQVSMQVLQDIYKEVTGKREGLRWPFK